VSHQIDLESLIDSAEWLQTVLGKPVPSALLKAGGFPPVEDVGAG